MDEFGVLTERYGLKPQGKSAPMAAAKRPTAAARDFGFNSGLDPKPTSNSSKSSWDSNPVKGSFFDDHDVLFQSNSKQKHVDSFGIGGDYGDIFGGFQKPTKQSSSNNYSSGGSSFDFDSMFSNSGAKTSSTNLYADDDIFGGMPGVNSSKNASDGDIFASFTSAPRKTTKNDDLLGDLGGGAMNSKSSSRNGSWETKKNDAGFEDLIPGFGGSSPNNSTNTKGTKSTFTSTEDPFVVLEAASNQSYTSSEHSMDPLDEFTKFTSVSTKSGVSSKASSTLRPPPKPAVKVNSPNVSSIDELEDFAMGKARSKPTRHKEAEDATKKTQQNGSDDLESFFGMNSRSSSVPKSRATTLDPMFDTKIHNRGQKPSARMAPRPSVKKSPPASMPNVVDDLSAIFGDAPIFREFEEVDGESEERRRARLGRHQRTQDRVAKAVADMNHRDRQSQHEQEERSRIAESLDFKIKQWAMGKEGNLRALLSSMQNVLWPECGWEPVSLTDLITATSVKKVYRKATLSVHPDKVQQKGATVEQKYIAEKVFDILKEAWNKFNKEELS